MDDMDGSREQTSMLGWQNIMDTSFIHLCFVILPLSLPSAIIVFRWGLLGGETKLCMLFPGWFRKDSLDQSSTSILLWFLHIKVNETTKIFIIWYRGKRCRNCNRNWNFHIDNLNFVFWKWIMISKFRLLNKI